MLGILPGTEGFVDFDLVKSFRKLAMCGRVKTRASPGHPDGWGIVTWQSGLPVYLGREPTNAYSDPRFEEACSLGTKIRVASPLIAHLRKASVGHKSKDNTHPFVVDEWAFAHNGTIRRLNLRSKTDSEWFFHSLMKQMKPGSGDSGDILSAIASQVDAVRQVYRYTSMTFLLSNGKTLFAYRDFRRDQDYYTMYYAKTSDSFVVAQEKFFEADWKELENGQLLIVDSKLDPEIIDNPELIVVRPK